MQFFRSPKNDSQATKVLFSRLPITLPIFRLLAIAGLLHLCLAVGLFIVGRAQLAPSVVDRDGIIGSFAFDSYQYQDEARQLASALRQGNFKTWFSSPAAVHVKLISIPFSVLSPLFGYSTLSAEPFNLICYLLVLTLVFQLGRELGSERTGLLAATIVALLPTFVLHNLQLLKDPLFIAAALAVFLFVTMWLTRTFNRRAATVIGVATAVTTLVLLRVRFNVGILIVAIVGCGFLLLALRQIIERRLLLWNMTCALPALLIAILVIGFSSPQSIVRSKIISANQVGQLKASPSAGTAVATAVVYRSHGPNLSSPRTSRLFGRADEFAFRIGTMRSRFSAAYPEAGSTIDRDAEIRDWSSLISYLPRALALGLWAPFPNTWLSAGHRIGSAGKLLSGGETLFIYLCQLMAIVALVRNKRQLSHWLLAFVTVLGVTALALIITNVGALYRFRYTFWILLIVLSAKGAEALAPYCLSWAARGLRVRAPAATPLEERI